MGLFCTYATAISELAKNHGMDRWTSGQKMTFYVIFNDQYLINYSTDHITTEPIQKIESKLYIHLLNFSHILTEITIKTNGRQRNSEFWWTLDWWTAYNFLIVMNVQGSYLSNYATNSIKTKLIRKIGSELCI